METKTVDWSKRSFTCEGDPCFHKMKTANEFTAKLKIPQTTQLPRWLPAAPQPQQSSEPLSSLLPPEQPPLAGSIAQDVLIEPPAQVMAVQGTFCFCLEKAACTTVWQHKSIKAGYFRFHRQHKTTITTVFNAH